MELWVGLTRISDRLNSRLRELLDLLSLFYSELHELDPDYVSDLRKHQREMAEWERRRKRLRLLPLLCFVTTMIVAASLAMHDLWGAQLDVRALPTVASVTYVVTFLVVFTR